LSTQGLKIRAALGHTFLTSFKDSDRNVLTPPVGFQPTDTPAFPGRKGAKQSNQDDNIYGPAAKPQFNKGRGEEFVTFNLFLLASPTNVSITFLLPTADIIKNANLKYCTSFSFPCQDTRWETKEGQGSFAVKAHQALYIINANRLTLVGKIANFVDMLRMPKCSDPALCFDTDAQANVMIVISCKDFNDTFSFLKDLKVFSFLLSIAKILKKSITDGSQFNTLNGKYPFTTYLLLPMPKPVNGTVKGEKDNNSQALYDTQRIGLMNGLNGIQTGTVSPAGALSAQKGEVEKVEVVSRTHTRSRAEEQLDSSLGVTRPTPPDPAQTLRNPGVTLVWGDHYHPGDTVLIREAYSVTLQIQTYVMVYSNVVTKSNNLGFFRVIIYEVLPKVKRTKFVMDNHYVSISNLMVRVINFTEYTTDLSPVYGGHNQHAPRNSKYFNLFRVLHDL
jgi:hypothetical protein